MPPKPQISYDPNDPELQTLRQEIAQDSDTLPLFEEPRSVAAALATAPQEAHARRSDPETSHSAAESLRGKLNDARREVLAFLCGAGENGLTDEELLQWCLRAALKRSPSGLRSRRAELAKLEPALVEDSLQRRKTALGHEAIVWRATPLAVQLLSDRSHGNG